MKKMLFFAVATTLVLTGCNGGQVSSLTSATEAVDTLVSTEAAVNDEELKAQCLARAQYGDILNVQDWSDIPLAPSVMIDDYLSGQKEYLGRYYEVIDNYLFATAYLGDNHVNTRRYFPEAVCGGTWTAEELIEGYCNQTLPWKSSSYETFYLLYTDDYRTCFEICDNWLWADGVKVYPVGQIALSVEPQDILYGYQHGQWDGMAPIFSQDFGTVVKIDHFNGTLEYEYESLKYSSGYDQAKMAHTGYDDPLAFMVTGENIPGEGGEFRVERTSEYNLDFENEYSGRHLGATVEMYIDLPNGTKDSFENLIHLEYAGPEIGMYVIMADKIELYRRGVLMNTWRCEVTDNNPITTVYRKGSVFAGETHVQISDDEIVRLLPNGEIETVLDGLTGDIFTIGEYSILTLSLKDGELRGYNRYCGVVNIAEDIASIDYTNKITLMTGKDGLCYAFCADDYMALEFQVDEDLENGKSIDAALPTYCLGTESWEQYLKLYNAGLLEFPIAE